MLCRQYGNECSSDLDPDCIFTYADKTLDLDLEIQFAHLEKVFNLPAGFDEFIAQDVVGILLQIELWHYVSRVTFQMGNKINIG